MRISSIMSVSLLAGTLLLACNKPVNSVTPPETPIVQAVSQTAETVVNKPEIPKDRSAIIKRMQAKIDAGTPLVAHIFVPLCDNDHQGIVPVNASLGNGQNTRSNLYWGAGYGMRTHFQRQKEWKTLSLSNPTETWILERVVLKKKYANGATVILVADAYDGAFMEQCLKDYFDALCGLKKGSIMAGEQKVMPWGGADLLAFNGHNGLMDMDIEDRKRIDGVQKDAVSIACASHSYFAPFYESASAYPLVTTNNLLAPEAYVMRGLIDNWAMLKTAEEIRFAAASAYNTYQKCGIKGASRLFHTGW